MAAFNWSVRVYYEDTDAAGLVYHSNYLKFLERARSEYLRHLGYTHQQLADQEDLVFVVSNINIHYKKPARFDDMLDVGTSIKKINAASFSFLQTIHRDNEEICHADVEIVCLDKTSYQPKRIPASMRTQFNHDD